MTLLCEFTVPGQPVPKARPRVVAGRTYTPERTKRAEQRIAEYFKVAYPHLKPTWEPVSLSLTFSLKGLRTSDWDNLAKLVCDALNGKAWVDDKQIIHATVRIWWNRPEPCTHVEAYT